MEPRSKKQQLEAARSRNDLSGKGDQFFDKFKSSDYDPLPDPGRFRIGWIIKPLIVLVIIGGLLYYGYTYLISDTSDDSNTADTGTGQVVGDNQDNNDITDDTSGTLGVTIASDISIGTNAEISYSLPSSFSGDDMESQSLELHLLTENNGYVGFIARPDFNKQGFIWDPKKVYEDPESDVVTAPSEGRYRLVVVLRDQDDVGKQLSELPQKQIGKVFEIEYDALSIETKSLLEFASCFEGVNDYKTIEWYDAFKRALDERSINENDIQIICYSFKSSLVVFASSQPFEKGHPTVMRFLTETESLSEAVYTQPLTSEIQADSISVGRRKVEVLPILINKRHVLNYNFLENTLSPA